VPSTLLGPLAYGFAIAAGTCFIISALALRLMRVRANARLAEEKKIPWVMELALRKRVIAGYRQLYPHGWGYRILRGSVILWTTFVILAVLAKILERAM
jgi:hypothetical protein